MLLEEMVAKLGRRLRHGRKCPECGASTPHHRPLRRVMGAVLSELAAEGAAELYWQRRRVRAAVDRKVAETVVADRVLPNAQIPSQRRGAPQTIDLTDINVREAPGVRPPHVR